MYPARSYRIKTSKVPAVFNLFSYCEDTTEIAQQGVLTLKSIFYHTLEKEKKMIAVKLKNRVAFWHRASLMNALSH